jgi:IS30 family transposase
MLKNITFKPNSRKSKTHISKYSVSEIAKMINKHPVDTFRNVKREKVIKLAVLPINPSKNVMG